MTRKSVYKMYVCDTGLSITLAFWDKSFTENKLFYYTFPASGKHLPKIDFLLSRGAKFNPVEANTTSDTK